MITFQNKTAGPVKINIDNKAIVINEYSEYNYESCAESLTFTVEDGDPKKPKLLGYLLLAIGGLIGFLMEITDSEFLDFRKALYLPVRANITNISKNIFVIINEPRENDINFCSITSDADLDVKTIIDENILMKIPFIHNINRIKRNALRYFLFPVYWLWRCVRLFLLQKI